MSGLTRLTKYSGVRAPEVIQIQRLADHNLTIIKNEAMKDDSGSLLQPLRRVLNLSAIEPNFTLRLILAVLHRGASLCRKNRKAVLFLQ